MHRRPSHQPADRGSSNPQIGRRYGEDFSDHRRPTNFWDQLKAKDAALRERSVMLEDKGREIAAKDRQIASLQDEHSKLESYLRGLNFVCNEMRTRMDPQKKLVRYGTPAEPPEWNDTTANLALEASKWLWHWDQIRGCFLVAFSNAEEVQRNRALFDLGVIPKQDLQKANVTRNHAGDVVVDGVKILEQSRLLKECKEQVLAQGKIIDTLKSDIVILKKKLETPTATDNSATEALKNRLRRLKGIFDDLEKESYVFPCDVKTSIISLTYIDEVPPSKKSDDNPVDPVSSLPQTPKQQSAVQSTNSHTTSPKKINLKKEHYASGKKPKASAASTCLVPAKPSHHKRAVVTPIKAASVNGRSQEISGASSGRESLKRKQTLGSASPSSMRKTGGGSHKEYTSTPDDTPSKRIRSGKYEQSSRINTAKDDSNEVLVASRSQRVTKVATALFQSGVSNAADEKPKQSTDRHSPLKLRANVDAPPSAFSKTGLSPRKLDNQRAIHDQDGEKKRSATFPQPLPHRVSPLLVSSGFPGYQASHRRAGARSPLKTAAQPPLAYGSGGAKKPGGEKKDSAGG